MRTGSLNRVMAYCAILGAVMFSAPFARAESGRSNADSLCERAERANRDAREAERKSEERKRFLKGASGSISQSQAARGSGSATVRQSIRSRIAQVRDILPQLRQGATSSYQDRGIVPGLSQYFDQMERSIRQALQAMDTCLDAPGSCSMPSFSCPAPPSFPAGTGRGQSADFVRKVQQSYAQAGNMAYQACQKLKNEAVGEIERLRQESRGMAANGGQAGSSQAQPFGETDLYLKRAESLKREASQLMSEADRVSGISGYCDASRRSSAGVGRSGDLIDALKANEKQERDTDSGLSYTATVVDLKSAWDQKWNRGKTLHASEVPLPKLSADDRGEATIKPADESPENDGPGWWARTKTAYQRADEQMELTEFIKSRPKELVKDVVKELIELNLGSVGKTLTTGYTILSAVKTTSDEVGEIMTDAPQVIATGSADDARELSARADRVPLSFLNNLFDDVTGKFPPPRYTYHYKKAAGNE